jgi:3-oxoacyl-(acyl-carrier-protein) synthase/acyl-coenzyme A synthetase/AMP-(fatty) acid ligase/acyl carrier protein
MHMHSNVKKFSRLLSRPDPKQPIAILDLKGSFPYEEFMAKIALCAEDWGEAIKPTSVAILLPPCRELFISAHAAVATGRAVALFGSEIAAMQTSPLLDSCGCEIVVATSDWAPTLAGLGMICTGQLEGGYAQIFRWPSNKKNIMELYPPPQVGTVAYIVPTSGSTGRAKAVAVGRKNLAVYMDWYQDATKLGPDDRISIASAVGFDMFINALFPPHHAGALVVIPKREELLHPPSFLRLLHEQEITFVNTTPSYGQLIAEASTPSLRLPHLRTIMFGGESLPASVAAAWKRIAPSAQILNCYGVAEATVTSFWHILTERDLHGPGPVPIGQPVACIDFDILTTNDYKPGAQEGVLQLRGDLVALGYIGREGTQGGFSASNKNTYPDSYLTGDLVYRSDDGTVTYLDRIDRQVKVAGGYRIDTTEVEQAILEMNSGISRVIVVTDQSGLGARLWAFCVASSNPPSEKVVIEAVQDRLPAHVRLTGVVFIDSPPMTENKKVDYAALRRLIPQNRNIPTPPLHRNDIREILKGSWSSALRCTIKGLPDEDFYLLGGTSYAFIQMLTSLEQTLGFSVNVERMLAFKTFGKQLNLLLDDYSEQTTSGQPRPPHRYHSEELGNLQKPRFEATSKRGRDEVHIIGAGIILPGLEGFDQFCGFLGAGLPQPDYPSPKRFAASPGLSGLCFPTLALAEWGASVPKDVLQYLDPQFLLWLAVAKQALGHSSISPENSRLGIFVGLGPTFFDGSDTDTDGKPHRLSLAGTTPSFAPGLLAHELNLSGPNMVIDTACSSSLVAVHLACNSIRSGEIEVAIAGGAQLFYSARSFRLLETAGIVSSSGVCRPFDIRADGYVPGEGAGAVVLASRAFVERNKSRTIAHVRGTFVNHDGKTPTLTMPCIERQKELYERVMALSHAIPEQVVFIEAHGTGTPLGDPVELAGIRETFDTDKREQPLYVGSVKGYIGHLHYAAGIMGLLKAAAQLSCGRMFAQPRLEFLNPRLALEGSKIQIPLLSCLLPPGAGLVNSFGFSGTNCCIYIERPNQDIDHFNRRLGSTESVNVDSTQLAPKTTASLVDIRDLLKNLVAAKLHVKVEQISLSETAIMLGLDSADCLEIQDKLSEALGRPVSPTLLLSNQSLDNIIEYLVAEKGEHRPIGKTIREVGYGRQKDGRKKQDTSDRSQIEMKANGSDKAVLTILKLINKETEILIKILEGINPEQALIENKIIWEKQHEILQELLDHSAYAIPDFIPEAPPEQVRLRASAGPDVHALIAEYAHLPVHMVSLQDDLVEDLGLSSLVRVDLCTRLLQLSGGNVKLFDLLLPCRTGSELLRVLTQADSA